MALQPVSFHVPIQSILNTPFLPALPSNQCEDIVKTEISFFFFLWSLSGLILGARVESLARILSNTAKLHSAQLNHGLSQPYLNPPSPP